MSKPSKCGMNGQGLSSDNRFYCHLLKLDDGNILEIRPQTKEGLEVYSGDRVRLFLSDRPSVEIKSLIDCLQDLLKNRGGK